MQGVVGVIGAACLFAGSVFVVIGGIGVVRLPNFFARMHGAGITDTLGAGLILVGLMFDAGLSLITAKLVILLFFLWITSPTATHALAQAALHQGLEPVPDESEDAGSPA